ncbi:MAG: ferrous iron transport protein B [Calditrichia bacterium]
MRIALIGQPNAGKSTLFNAVAGYKSVTSNLPGTTVKFTESTVRLNGDLFEIIDFPGTYSLSSTNDAEAEVRKNLISGQFDLIINVLDASQLGRSLPLTLELLELHIPVIVSLNMLDEAQRKGLEINISRLQELLGCPVYTTIASKNIGVKELFKAAKKAIENSKEFVPGPIKGHADVEKIIAEAVELLSPHRKAFEPYPLRLVAIKLLEDDSYFWDMLKLNIPGWDELTRAMNRLQKKLVRLRGKPVDSVLVLERHAVAMDIYNQVVTVGAPQSDWRDRLDDVLMHRFWGYAILVTVLVLFFNIVFQMGAYLETHLLAGFEYLEEFLPTLLNPDSFAFHLTRSFLWGISGGLAIVLPYLVPFLIGLNILEDIGYLPRVAYLMDAFMHRMGLHGTSVIPAVLGYGCNVPAVMATRILSTRRDKIIAAIISSMVPCSARSIVIFGLVAYYLGPMWALGIYILNIFIIAFTGRVLSSLMPEPSPGMILEIPAYRLPAFRVVKKKTWFRIREFIVVAWPILIAGSVILGLLEYFQLTHYINLALSPLTKLLSLPVEVGTTLIFGVFRKELSLIMLTQALGTNEVLSVISTGQILTFTIFVTFYIPCVATMAVLAKELGNRWMGITVLMTLLIAVVLSLFTMLGWQLLG